MNRTTILSISLIIFITVAFLMITGSSLLLIPLIKEPYVPMGNLLSLLGFISLPLLILSTFNGLYRPQSMLEKGIRKCLLAFIIMAILWVPVAYALAGNWANNFEGQESFIGGVEASRLFWAFNYFLIIGPILIMLIYLIVRTINKKKGSKST